MSTDRDTHFLGFAKLLYDDIYHRIEQEYGPMHSFRPKVRQAVEQIIAQRAYDLAYHVLAHAPLAIAYEDATLVSERVHILVSFTPDLTSWPAPQSAPPTA